MRLLQSIYASERNAGDISISLSDFNEFLETGGLFYIHEFSSRKDVLESRVPYWLEIDNGIFELKSAKAGIIHFYAHPDIDFTIIQRTFDAFKEFFGDREIELHFGFSTDRLRHSDMVTYGIILAGLEPKN